jgi:hypothetical protein
MNQINKKIELILYKIKSRSYNKLMKIILNKLRLIKRMKIKNIINLIRKI